MYIPWGSVTQSNLREVESYAALRGREPVKDAGEHGGAKNKE